MTKTMIYFYIKIKKKTKRNPNFCAFQKTKTNPNFCAFQFLSSLTNRQ